MLGHRDVTATVAVRDLQAARRWYEDKLGLSPIHVEGKTQLMAHATKARVSKCTTSKGACPVTTVEFNGICDLQLSGVPATKGNFIATVVDHAECDSLPDTYSIVIRSGPWIGKGDIVHEASGPMECGGLRVSPAKK